jgi:hypothetical protein
MAPSISQEYYIICDKTTKFWRFRRTFAPLSGTEHAIYTLRDAISAGEPEKTGRKCGKIIKWTRKNMTVSTSHARP